mgnify:FL=1
MSVEVLLLLGGLAGVLVGAEWLVRGAAGLALALGVSPLLVGLTVVAWGTSSPELVVSLVAAFQDSTDIAVGNVVGSNIFNVLFILGLSAVAAPLVVHRQLVRLEVPLLIVVSFLVWIFAADGSLSRTEGAVLIVLFLAYSALSIVIASRQATENSVAVVAGKQRPWIWNAALAVVGLALLVVGSRWFVIGAAAVARWLGVSELIIGLTIVAAGTSLPELATSVVASLRGERDISVGNVVGSNLFNLLAVLGPASCIPEGGLVVSAPALHFDIPVMTAAAFACLPIFVTGHRIARWEGALLVGYGLAYWLYLFLATTHHDALTMFNLTMVLFAFPLTLTGLAVSLGRHLLRTAEGNTSTAG